MMMGMSSETISRISRAASMPLLPGIILSAYDWTAVEQEARSVGVDAFIASRCSRAVSCM